MRSPLALLLIAACGRAATVSDDDGVRASGDLRPFVEPFAGDAPDAARIVALAGDARVVLLGEASHGGDEFYRSRAAITRALVEQAGFDAVLIEGDWTDAERVDDYVRAAPGADRDAAAALGGFSTFPQWMWRNAAVRDFVAWIRTHNDALPDGAARVRVYGLDVYGVRESAAAVIAYLDGVDPGAAARARDRYACLSRHGAIEDYAAAVAQDPASSCEAEVRAARDELESLPGEDSDDARFRARRNAAVVAGGEAYTRVGARGGLSWNVRDVHFADTVDAVLAHLDGADPARVVVWAHNSHVGDARATEVAERGELNVGQLARERHPGETWTVGFTGHAGAVTAAPAWGAAGRRYEVRPSLDGSWERLLHDVGEPRFLLPLRDPAVAAALGGPRLERAIGVVYAPATERQSHYFAADLTAQFDAVIHFDTTTAVEPLAAPAAASSAQRRRASRR